MAVRTRQRVVAARSGEGHYYGLLLGVLAGAYVISAFVPGRWVRAVQIGLFVLVVLLAVRTSGLSRRIARIAGGIVLAGAAAAIGLTRDTAAGLAVGGAFAWITLTLLFALALVIRRVLTAGRVTLQSIFGAVSAYLIIGLLFAAGYEAIGNFAGGPFFAGGRNGSVETFQYFSFATLTTVGYGDFTAAASSGRAVAVMEALVGQVFLATLVARLVSGYGHAMSAASDPAPARCPHPASRRRRAAPSAPEARSRYHRGSAPPR